MRHGGPLSLLTLLTVACLTQGCGHPSASGTGEKPPGEKVVNLYIWSDYMAPDTVSSFEATTGIKVHVAYFGDNETMEARISAGHSGFDVVMPTGFVLRRQIRSNMYMPLDKSKLPNLANLDPQLMARLPGQDPHNPYAVIYTWGTVGIGFNDKMIRERLGGDPPASWRLVFDPTLASKLASCGINLIEDPAGIVQLALIVLGKDAYNPSDSDLEDVSRRLAAIRPYIRNIDTSGDIEALANGDVCVALTYNGDFVQARKRAIEAKNGQQLRFVLPDEGSTQWFDNLAIPRDAPHPDNAHALINYLMDPQVIAHITQAIGFANANAKATPLIDSAILGDPAVYATLEQRRRLTPPAEYSPEQLRAITRLWQRFKTGQ
jgi:putrescine transport system substrate-binding protein